VCVAFTSVFGVEQTQPTKGWKIRKFAFCKVLAIDNREDPI